MAKIRSETGAFEKKQRECESVEYGSKKERDRRWEVIQDLQELLL
jgi:ribosomal protein L37E